MHRHYTVNINATEVSHKEDKDEDEENKSNILKYSLKFYCYHSFNSLCDFAK